MPIVILIAIFFVFVYWDSIVQFLTTVGIVVIGLVLAFFVIQLGFIIARTRAEFRQRMEREERTAREIEERKRREAEWRRANIYTLFLHVRLDPQGYSKSATVRSGKFHGRDVVGMDINELYEFRIESLGAGDETSWRVVDVLRQQSEGPKWSSRLGKTDYLFVLWNEDQTRALRAHFRFLPELELRGFAGKEIAEQSGEIIRNSLRYFEDVDQASAHAVKDIFDHKARDSGGRNEDGERRFGGMSPSTMTRRDAAEILGLDVGSPDADVHTRFRKLQQAVHPDREGSARLAQLVNQARVKMTEPPDRDEFNRHHFAGLQSSGEMSHSEAMEILGLEEDFTVSDVKHRTRKVVGLVHPGTGGSERLEQLVLQAQRIVQKGETC